MLFVLTGPVHSGKTTFLAGAADRWKASGFRVGGFLSVARLRDGSDQGYDLVDLKNGTSAPFLMRKGEPDWPSVGPYRFVPEILEQAAAIMSRDRDAEILIVDEIGPLELDGEGLWPAFEKALAHGSRCLCVVREEILDEFRARVGPAEPRVFRPGAPGVLGSLTAALNADRGSHGSPRGGA